MYKIKNEGEGVKWGKESVKGKVGNLANKPTLNSGITLIALVITIIVLLILAGVAISTLTGENGILNRAEEAKNSTIIGYEKEGISLSFASCKAQNLYEGNVTSGEMQIEMTNNGYDALVSEGENESLTVYYNNSQHTYMVYQSGIIEQIVEASFSMELALSYNNIKLQAGGNIAQIVDDNIPVPNGFYYVGGTKDTGVVISSEKADDMNNSAGGDQFVWVPVNQNQKLTLTITSDKENISKVKIYKPDGRSEEITVNAKSYEKDIEMPLNGTYSVEAYSDTNSMKKASKRVTTLYGRDMEEWCQFLIDRAKEWGTNYETMGDFLNGRTLEQALEDEGYSTLSSLILDGWYYIEEIEDEMMALAIEEYYVDNNNDFESVSKYGGFYIGRFETGDCNASEPRKRGAAEETVLGIKKNLYPYTYVTTDNAINKIHNISADYASVQSQMITGAAYDRTIYWFLETSMTKENFYWSQRQNFGNFSHIIKTGSDENYNVNNIYDLFGNAEEVTSENNEGWYCQRGDGVRSHSTAERFRELERNGMSKSGGEWAGRTILYIQ